jgi:hypothetical protein
MLFSLASVHVATAQVFDFSLEPEGVISAGQPISTETSTAQAQFQLHFADGMPELTRIDYSIDVSEFDLDGTKTPDLTDDITAIHLHTLNECVSATCIAGDTAGTKHVLNIFGVPREDDADLSLVPAESLISGSWDPTDANELTPAPSVDPNDFLGELSRGELFLMIHTRGNPAGAVGGRVVPEPTAGALSIGAMLGLGCYFRRRRICGVVK